MRIHFWNGPSIDRGNFGDLLTGYLFSKHGIAWDHSGPAHADLFGIGSILHRIPDGFTGVVWTTGAKYAHTRKDLTHATVLALRGDLTRRQTGASCEVLADGGLLAGLYAADRSVRWKTGVIGHWQHKLEHDGHQIDVLGDVQRVIDEAASCEQIVSSSLHGLILADSLGLPSKWIPAPNLARERYHKVADYASSFGITIEPGVWREPPTDQVCRKQAALRETLNIVAGTQ